MVVTLLSQSAQTDLGSSQIDHKPTRFVQYTARYLRFTGRTPTINTNKNKLGFGS